MNGPSARGLEPLTEDEHIVLMQMSGDFAYPAARLAECISEEKRDCGWTPKRVNKAQKGLRAKGYASFGHLTSEDDNYLRGRGYWLSGAGWDLRYGEDLDTPAPLVFREGAE